MSKKTLPNQSVKVPLPGKPVRGSRSGQPIMVLFDLLGRRWSLGIIWNLHEGTKTFRALRESCLSCSPTVLNTRLKELRYTGLVEKLNDGYGLTAEGKNLFKLLEPLGDWSYQWVDNNR